MSKFHKASYPNAARFRAWLWRCTLIIGLTGSLVAILVTAPHTFPALAADSTETLNPGAATSDSPTATTTPTPSPTLTYYPGQIIGEHEVKPSENLLCIARAYGIEPSAIQEANQLTNANQLNVGLKLKIPYVVWVNPPAGKVCQSQFPPVAITSRALIITFRPSVIPVIRTSPQGSSGPQPSPLPPSVTVVPLPSPVAPTITALPRRGDDRFGPVG